MVNRSVRSGSRRDSVLRKPTHNSEGLGLEQTTEILLPRLRDQNDKALVLGSSVKSRAPLARCVK